ncbi:hypothetical protein [Pedobacter psychroterrae]|uniref:MG2 domain-containing protein n=1 Tax=Pedobacter psychroterrae TaxID=2530453 RepID=A0A4R0NL13_9SPHI|nr:hypothetical protein [Pedobacter psychroterrae]TCD00183.1 hypothetical protein EZ437_15835 [Pedobacter psychroterrae]
MMKYRYLLIILSVISLGSMLAFISLEESPVERIIAALDKWEDTHLQEKVYIHTDRPGYSIGDTIWFKGYVTIGSKHQLSALSGALYVELVTEKDSVAQLLKLPITAGMAKGNFALTESMKEGNYRLRAYTQWMRNAGADYFYDKLFQVMNATNDIVFTSIDYSYTTSGNGTYLTANLNYTDSMGKPLTYLPIKYNLRKSYNTLFKGEGITDNKGKVSVVLKDFKIDEISGTHLNTTIEMEEFAVVSKSFPIKIIAGSADVRFFPEGGELVNGIRTKIAFKSVGQDGLGLLVKGTITDQTGNEVGLIESNRFGMGAFLLTPQNGNQYQAKINYPDGSTKTVKLPMARDYGYTLEASYDKEADFVAIRVGRQLPYPSPEDEVYLILQSGGNVKYSARMPMKNSSVVLNIPTGELPSGIAQITLFSATGEPMNERIFFVQHNDQMDLKLASKQGVYKPRELVEINLDAQDSKGMDVTASFSVSVVHEDTVPADERKEHTIFSHILLSSDIKGYIEQPNYYFHAPDKKTRKDLDLLMLTQGYRRFNWKKLLGDKPFSAHYIPETIVTDVSGRLVDLWGAKVQHGRVYMINNNLGLVLSEATDEVGRFKFKNLIITEGLRFSVMGRKKNNGKRLEVLLDKYALQRLTVNANLPDILTDFRKVKKAMPEQLTKEEEARVQRSLAQGRLLKEVKIRAVQRTPGINTIKGQISQTIIFDERDSGKTILKALRDRAILDITFVRRQKGSYAIGTYLAIDAYIKQQKMDIVINDSIRHEDSIFDVLGWDVEDVIKVDIVRSGDVVKPTMLIYTRSIYVRNPVDPLDPRSPSKWTPEIVNIFPRGFDKVKEFYVPRYDVRYADSKADLRKTVYWNPSVSLNGKTKGISFYNGDRKGNYRIVVEGINTEGQLGRQVFRYRVE